MHSAYLKFISCFDLMSSSCLVSIQCNEDYSTKTEFVCGKINFRNIWMYISLSAFQQEPRGFPPRPKSPAEHWHHNPFWLLWPKIQRLFPQAQQILLGDSLRNIWERHLRMWKNDRYSVREGVFR